MQPGSRHWFLTPSPLLGPTSWGAVDRCLQSRGHHVTVAAAAMTTTGHDDHIAPWLAELLDRPVPAAGTPVTVVGHSAACPRIPYLVDALLHRGWSVRSYICVDGRFPDGEAFVSSGQHFGAMLDSIVRPDDYLPPWPRWWGSLVEGLVVDPAARDLVFSEAVPIPRSWFDQACPVPTLPEAVRPAFLSFGPGYAESRDRAHAEGWLTHRLDGDHLHQVVAPYEVTDTLEALAACLDSGR